MNESAPGRKIWNPTYAYKGAPERVEYEESGRSRGIPSHEDIKMNKGRARYSNMHDELWGAYLTKPPIPVEI